MQKVIGWQDVNADEDVNAGFELQQGLHEPDREWTYMNQMGWDFIIRVGKGLS